MNLTALRDRLLPLAQLTTGRAPATQNNRVLLLQPDHLGDVILSEPAVRMLRRAMPETELVAVVGPWSAEIAELAWPVDRIIEVEFPGFQRTNAAGSRSEPYRYLSQAVGELRTIAADDAIVLRDDAWWAAWLGYAATGGAVVTANDPRASRFATVVSTMEPALHRTTVAIRLVRTYFDILGVIPPETGSRDAPQISVTHTGSARELISDAFGDPVDHYIVVHPGSGAPVKAWLSMNWRAVVQAFPNTLFVITGSAAESDLCTSIASMLENATSVAGQTTLMELLEILDDADLVVGTDNGPMHLAGALGTPTIRLFGPSQAQIYGPPDGDDRQIIIDAGWNCPACGNLSSDRAETCGCMLAIRPNDVIDAIRKLAPDAA